MQCWAQRDSYTRALCSCDNGAQEVLVGLRELVIHLRCVHLTMVAKKFLLGTES